MPAIDLTPIWSFVRLVADAYEKRRAHLDSTQQWRDGASTHLPGIAGQIGVALLTGQPTDVLLRNGGDGGTDFAASTDLKTTTYWPPILKHPVGAERWPVRFALAHLSALHVVSFWGAVKAEDLRDGFWSYRHTFNEAAGPQHCLDGAIVNLLYRSAYRERLV